MHIICGTIERHDIVNMLVIQQYVQTILLNISYAEQPLSIRWVKSELLTDTRSRGATLCDELDKYGING